MAAPQGIGPMAELGPGGAYAGRIPGLIPALHLTGDLGSMALGAAIGRRRKAKDFNDQEADDILGTTPDGRKIKDK